MEQNRFETNSFHHYSVKRNAEWLLIIYLFGMVLSFFCHFPAIVTSHSRAVIGARC